MTRYAAFLRAVNVGGTGKFPMAELRLICEGLGFSNVQTYIASGNVVFESTLGAVKIKSTLGAEIAKYLGKPAEVFIRDKAEVQNLIADVPFPQAEGNRLMVILLDHTPARAMIDAARFKTDEQIALGNSCLYVHYPSGMGQSKLKIPGAEQGTRAT